MNFPSGEPIGLWHLLGQKYYKNKTKLRYNFGSVYYLDSSGVLLNKKNGFLSFLWEKHFKENSGII